MSVSAPTDRERPRGSRAVRDERATVHSITSSARTSRAVGIVRPSVLAVLRLMISSTLVACPTWGHDELTLILSCGVSNSAARGWVCGANAAEAVGRLRAGLCYARALSFSSAGQPPAHAPISQSSPPPNRFVISIKIPFGSVTYADLLRGQSRVLSPITRQIPSARMRRMVSSMSSTTNPT